MGVATASPGEMREADARPLRSRRAVRAAAIVGLTVLIAAGVLIGRGAHRGSSSSPGAASAKVTMPVSQEIEATYGLRFTVVGVTAGGGMIQVQYQVLDSDKTAAVHDPASAPYIVDSHGARYADPGMVGHNHVGKVKSPGATDFVLLANAQGGVRPGSNVTIKIGKLELRNVPVQ